MELGHKKNFLNPPPELVDSFKDRESIECHIAKSGELIIIASYVNRWYESTGLAKSALVGGINDPDVADRAIGLVSEINLREIDEQKIEEFISNRAALLTVAVNLDESSYYVSGLWIIQKDITARAMLADLENKLLKLQGIEPEKAESISSNHPNRPLPRPAER